jgi:hypothetical protein
MYRGKKTFSYLNNLSAPRNETLCHFLKPGDFVVQLDGECKKYLKFASVDAFFFWYSAIPAPLRMFSEVVFEGPQKFRVDVDDKLCTDEIDELIKCIHEVFDNPQIVEYDIKTSHHFVVSNFHLASSRDCYYIAMKLQSLLSPSLESKIDWGVYKSTQNFRLEWSTKYQQKRWKIRTTTHNPQTLNPQNNPHNGSGLEGSLNYVERFPQTSFEGSHATLRDETLEPFKPLELTQAFAKGEGTLRTCCSGSRVPFNSVKGSVERFDVDSFKKGVLGFTQDTQPKLVLYIPSNPTLTQVKGSLTRCVRGSSQGYDPNVFKVRKKIGSMILLDRIKPAYCSVCKRTHDHENAYMITPTKFFCRRATVTL